MSCLERADRFEEALLQCPADAHDFTGRLHLRGERVVRLRELIKRKARHLGDNIVEGRLKGSRRIGKRDLVERHSDADFGGDAGDGITAGFGGKSRRAGNTRIDFDQVILKRIRIQRELDVAAAFDLKGADHLERTVAQHVILPVGKGLRGAHDNGIPGVDAHRIHVFHVADGDGSVVPVAHHFIFNFLVTLHTFLNQHLADRGEREGIFHDGNELLFTVRESASGSPESESRPQNDRVADIARRLQAFFHGAGNLRRQDGLAQTKAQLLEQLAVFRLLN